MHPQSELENYKLQVELLQEKLHRSEDNRQELEGKLEQIMKKRNEHERTLRSRSQRKYQQFLDEQKKRNERNRKLVEMLEQIDQQAAALSARSERLKMMKLQYELYFSKLVQSYSMKTIQSIPTVPFLPIQTQSNAYTAVKTDDVVAASFNNNTPQFQTVPIPVVVPIANKQNPFRSSWAFATAPPGVLITLANNSLPSNDIGDNTKKESNFSFDYSQFPIGYLQTSTPNAPMQCNVSQSYAQQPQQQKPSMGAHSKQMFTLDNDSNQSGPQFEYRDQNSSSYLFDNIKTNEKILNRTQPDLNQKIFDLGGDKAKKNDDLEINDDKGNGHEAENLLRFRVPEMSNNDSSVLRQSLKVDKLPNINPNNSFQQRTDDGRIVHIGNKPNTIDFRTEDDDEYIKYKKEKNGTYEKNVPIPFNVVPPEPSIDNITTTLQIQKIDGTNVRDDEKINDVEDNEKNTSSAFPPLGGKCSMESIGDEALARRPLENKTKENTSYTAARNIDPSRDTEQITLFNGTKNSKDERTEASNRTTAIIDGGGENTKYIENTRLETSYRPMHFDKKEKMSIENIETAIYGELLPKPESFASGDSSRPQEIEYNSQETEQYESNNSRKDLYQQEHDLVEVKELKDKSFPTEQRDIESEEVTGNNQHTFNFADNITSEGTQEYDMQNYNYSNPEQEYKEASPQEEMAPQEFQYTDDGQQQPQIENYPTDYQNYDGSQYQTEYDPNTYQYDYEQQQYDDPHQGQFAPEMYNQEYQQDPYSGEYTNYEQSESNELDSSNQEYTEQQYATEPEQQVAAEEIEKTEQVPVDTETDVSKQNSPEVNVNKEDEVPQKIATPTSILATDKHTDLVAKKKKRVNFIDSETDESSTLPRPEALSSESDFDFSAN